LCILNVAYSQTEEYEFENNGEAQYYSWNDFIQNYGQGYVTEAVTYITNQAIQDGRLPNSTYTFREVLSLTETTDYIQNVQSFDFHVFAESENNLTDVHIYFTLNLPWINGGGIQQVGSYYLSAYVFETESFTEDSSEFAQEEVDFDSLLPSLDDTEGFIEIDWASSDEDQNLQSLLQYGFDYVIQKGIDSGELTPVDYAVGDVRSATVELGQGIYYNFNVDANSQNNPVANLNYLVINQPWAGIHVVTSYSITPYAGV